MMINYVSRNSEDVWVRFMCRHVMRVVCVCMCEADFTGNSEASTQLTAVRKVKNNILKVVFLISTL